MRRLLTRRRDETGTGGVEVLPLGVLAFIVGTLIAVNVWGVVDAKMTVSTAAREAVRAYVETPPDADPQARAVAAASTTLRALGRTARPASVSVTGSFIRCGRVRATVGYAVPAIRLPWVGGLGTVVAQSTASEIVDPLRSGIEGSATCVR